MDTHGLCRGGALAKSWESATDGDKLRDPPAPRTRTEREEQAQGKPRALLIVRG